MQRSRFYLPFLIADRYHFETLDRYEPARDQFKKTVDELLPDTWITSRSGAWFSCRPPGGGTLPAQGWKIHVSACREDADRVLAAAVPILVTNETLFKYLIDRQMLARMNSKNWSRGGSGKFVTIYPRTTDLCRSLLASLADTLKGCEGPYVLSDRRFGDSRVVHYRYGGFQHRRQLSIQGEQIPVIEQPDGSLQPDIREPFYSPPEWVEPLFPEEGVSDPESQLGGNRYEIVKVLQFSNSGGVYVAVDRTTGIEVIIKEARPGIQGSGPGIDSVSLLQKEHRLLTKLRGLQIAPEPIELFQDWEHWYLVQERVQGKALSDYSARTNVSLMTSPTDEDYATYLDHTVTILARLAVVLRQLHSKGIVFGDLSPHNIMIPERAFDLRLVDFEGAVEVGVDGAPALFTPGFTAPQQWQGAATSFATDLYAFGAIGAALLFPVNAACELAPELRERFLAELSHDVGLSTDVTSLFRLLLSPDATQRPPLEFVEQVLADPSAKQRRRPAAVAYDARGAAEAMAGEIRRFLIARMDLARADTILPADTRVFGTNPLSVAHGGFGIARALLSDDQPLPGSFRRWLLSQPVSERSCPPGLFMGLAGIAWTLADLGETEGAASCYLLMAAHSLRRQTHDLYYGEAGIGLAALRLYSSHHEPHYLDEARRIATWLEGRAVEREQGLSWPDRGEMALGIAHGASGVALFLLRLFETSGDQRYLDLGRRALDFDLSKAIETKSDALSWSYAADIPAAVLPYWQYGSAGVGCIVARYYQATRDPRLLAILRRIHEDARRKYAAGCGRLMGLAGIGEFLLDAREVLGADAVGADLQRLVRGLELYAVSKPDGVVFPGERFHRLSCDYATGSAGVLLFLRRFLSGGPADLLDITGVRAETGGVIN